MRTIRNEDTKPIIIIINSLKKGGAERMAATFANYIAKSTPNHNIYIYTTDKENKNYQIDQKIKIHELPLASASRSPLFFFTSLIQAFYLYFKHRGPSHIISFLHRSTITAALFSIISKNPYVASERSVFSRSYKGIRRRVYAHLLRFSYNRASRVIFISNSSMIDTEKSLNMRLQKKSVVIHNPVDLELFGSHRKPNSLPPCVKSELKVVTAGRLIASKNPFVSFDICSEISQRYPISLDFLGDGPLREKIVARSNQYKTNLKVRTIGVVNDIEKWLPNYDFLLFTSAHESFGNVALEAIASGIPVIYNEELESLNEVFLDFPSLALAINTKKSLKATSREIINFIQNINPSEFERQRIKMLSAHNIECIFSAYLREIFNKTAGN